MLPHAICSIAWIKSIICFHLTCPAYFHFSADQSSVFPVPNIFEPHGHCGLCYKTEQELSYRKQIARQLCTQYVDGIYGNPVTLKSRLRVTQDHWKRNHWIDHTRLIIS